MFTNGTFVCLTLNLLHQNMKQKGTTKILVTWSSMLTWQGAARTSHYNKIYIYKEMGCSVSTQFCWDFTTTCLNANILLHHIVHLKSLGVRPLKHLIVFHLALSVESRPWARWSRCWHTSLLLNLNLILYHLCVLILHLIVLWNRNIKNVLITFQAEINVEAAILLIQITIQLTKCDICLKKISLIFRNYIYLEYMSLDLGESISGKDH